MPDPRAATKRQAKRKLAHMGLHVNENLLDQAVRQAGSAEGAVQYYVDVFLRRVFDFLYFETSHNFDKFTKGFSLLSE